MSFRNTLEESRALALDILELLDEAKAPKKPEKAGGSKGKSAGKPAKALGKSVRGSVSKTRRAMKSAAAGLVAKRSGSRKVSTPQKAEKSKSAVKTKKVSAKTKSKKSGKIAAASSSGGGDPHKFRHRRGPGPGKDGFRTAVYHKRKCRYKCHCASAGDHLACKCVDCVGHTKEFPVSKSYKRRYNHTYKPWYRQQNFSRKWKRGGGTVARKVKSKGK
jgi:hypothetical protein